LLQDRYNKAGFVAPLYSLTDLDCNPAAVTEGARVYPTSNAAAHLLCVYAVSPAQTDHTVAVTNELGTEDLSVSQPDHLCVPTWSSLTDPPNMTPSQPAGLDPFVCYYAPPATGGARFKVPKKMQVSDDFSPTTKVRVTISAPVSLCVPATETANGVRYKAANPKPSLVCILVTATPTTTPVFDQDQFGSGPVSITQTSTLCLPSLAKTLNSAK
jgi:hypothetical protein